MTKNELIQLFIDKTGELDIEREEEAEFWLVNGSVIHGFVINDDDVKHIIDSNYLDTEKEYITHSDAAAYLCQ